MTITKRKILGGAALIITLVVAAALSWPDKVRSGIHTSQNALGAFFQVVDQVDEIKDAQED